ncbi:MAG: HD domain-containing protein [Gammaproteobacteria bacterium]|nr:HD domain-containing protein [Gammaproteobacteria bacterium]
MSTVKEPKIELKQDLADTVNSEGYIEEVTKLGDKMEVVAGEDILTKTYHKLISKGTKIDSSFYEKLVQHKLLKPIDRSLIASDGVNTDKLVAETSILLGRDARFKNMFIKYSDLPMQIFRNVHFENALSIKLTIIREAMPRLFKHSIQVGLVAIYLGLRKGLINKDLFKLATAAMFHDIGELHINPELQNPEHRLDDDDWYQIYAHPFISYLILKEFPFYHPSISTIVLDHHEKIDGSGYPRGVKREEINPLGQILSIAEVTVGLMNKNLSSEDMEAKLKLCQGEYDREYLGYLVDVFRETKRREESPLSHSLQVIDKRMSLVNGIIDEWQHLLTKLNEQQREQLLVSTITERLDYLHTKLVGTGFVPEDTEVVYTTLGEEDDEWLTETSIIVDEAMFQIHKIIGEVKRRWPQHKDPHKARTLGEYLSLWLNESENKIYGNMARPVS